MKILYVYHEYYKRRMRYAHEMEALGHDVELALIRGKMNANQVGVSLIKEAAPDLVWVLSPFYIEYSVISVGAQEYLKAKNIPVVSYGTLNTGTPFTEMLDTWKRIDFFFAQQRDFANYMRDNDANAFYMPLAFYPDQYYLCRKEPKYDITFMGSPQTTVDAKDDRRLRCLKHLQKHFDVKVFGARFNERGVKAEHFGTHEEQRKVYSHSKINLDLPYINSPLDFYKSIFHAKNRFFEIPATGNFLLTGRCDEFSDILDDSMVAYYDTGEHELENLVDTASRYLKDDNLRLKMAERAYQVVHEKHTFRHRFESMFKILKEHGI